ncbi:Uncharacterised protein [Bordetella ansorpii]|uniref:Uncharacterized protein n=1 Tax=Bordetella ansorpii TaxID=288768 RepID=A0A157SVF3_9BORD|nr:Uncharacterised protein [Bordetella ansorpii]
MCSRCGSAANRAMEVSRGTTNALLRVSDHLVSPLLAEFAHQPLRQLGLHNGRHDALRLCPGTACPTACRHRFRRAIRSRPRYRPRTPIPPSVAILAVAVVVGDGDLVRVHRYARGGRIPGRTKRSPSRSPPHRRLKHEFTLPAHSLSLTARPKKNRHPITGGGDFCIPAFSRACGGTPACLRLRRWRRRHSPRHRSPAGPRPWRPCARWRSAPSGHARAWRGS